MTYKVLGDKYLQQDKFQFIQVDTALQEIQREYRLRERPTGALVYEDQVWVSYSSVPWDLENAYYERVKKKKTLLVRKTYKDNPFFSQFEDRLKPLLIALLRPDFKRVHQFQAWVTGADKVNFEVYHLYGSTWFYEKTCTLFCEIHGDDLVVVNVTTPNSKWDMRERNRKMIGEGVKWKEYLGNENP